MVVKGKENYMQLRKTHHLNKEDRQEPLMGITILAWLSLLSGSAAILLGMKGIIASDFLWTNRETFLSSVSVLRGIGDIVFGIGAIQRKPWAWMLGIIIECIGIGIDIGSGDLSSLVPFGKALGSIVVGFIILYYLLRPKIHQAFQHEI
jgi:hypothetical protein